MLIDSHALLWFVAGERTRISRSLQRLIERDVTAVSVASLWEIAIKAALGKLEAPDDLPNHVAQLGFDLLSVRPEHAWRVRDLPHHHRDPFDRLLIAQAQSEQLAIVTSDPAFAAYDVTVVWDPA